MDLGIAQCDMMGLKENRCDNFYSLVDFLNDLSNDKTTKRIFFLKKEKKLVSAEEAPKHANLRS